MAWGICDWGGVCMTGEGACMAGYGTCMAGGAGGHEWLGVCMAGHLSCMVGERVILILMGCCLVSNNFGIF